jgi:hypothetical protein
VRIRTSIGGHKPWEHRLINRIWYQTPMEGLVWTEGCILVTSASNGRSPRYLPRIPILRGCIATCDLDKLSFTLDWTGQQLHYQRTTCGQKSPTSQSHLLQKQVSCLKFQQDSYFRPTFYHSTLAINFLLMNDSTEEQPSPIGRCMKVLSYARIVIMVFWPS